MIFAPIFAIKAMVRCGWIVKLKRIWSKRCVSFVITCQGIANESFLSIISYDDKKISFALLCFVLFYFRTLVNLVTHPTVSLVLSMDRLPSLPAYCHIGRLFQCTCFEGQLYSQHKKLYRKLELEYRTIFQRVARRPEFHRNDFTVVFQPFGVNATIFMKDNKPDINLMAVDCLHLSQKGQAIMANALWNNMMQSERDKSIGLKPLYEEFECPSEQNPYIKTYFNSWIDE